MLHVRSEEEAASRFARTIDLLRDPEAPLTAEAIYSLSDLPGERLQAFRALWPQLPAARRLDLVTRLVETMETNFELDFSALIRPALDDADMDVRRVAIEGVLEDSPPPVIERLMKLAQDDPFSEVRAAAVKALAMFVLRGELGKLSDDLNTRLQDTVLALHNNLNEDLDVRRRALESIANCGREGVSSLIREAYYADDLPMRVSAVFAMGRSCDEAWLPQIMDELSSDESEMRYEAARAAGELELRPALGRLVELAYEDDREIQEMAIWAMGEIGGKTARQTLTDLAALADSTEDAELADAVAEAQSAALLAGEDLLPLFDYSEYDDDSDEDLDEIDPDLLYGRDDEEEDEDDDLELDSDLLYEMDDDSL